MRTAFMMIATAISLAMSQSAQAQSEPVQQRNNDASVDGAVRNTPGRTLENRTPEGDARGSVAPEGDRSGTTTGSPPSAVERSIETETGLGTLMDSDESEASRNRAPGGQRR